MATYCSTLAWKILWTEEPGMLQSMGHKDSDTTVHMYLTIAASNIRWIMEKAREFQEKHLFLLY